MQKAFFLLILLCCQPVFSATLSGTVKNGSTPINSATVNIYIQGESVATGTTSTDSNGVFSFRR